MPDNSWLANEIVNEMLLSTFLFNMHTMYDLSFVPRQCAADDIWTQVHTPIAISPQTDENIWQKMRQNRIERGGWGYTQIPPTYNGIRAHARTHTEEMEKQHTVIIITQSGVGVPSKILLYIFYYFNLSDCLD